MPLGASGQRARRRVPKAAEAGSPSLLFSDLAAAPKTGWSASEPNKGAAVTVWHYDLGSATRGTDYITACGVYLTDDADYAEWNVASQDHIHLHRTTFWLNSAMTTGAGTITLTNDGGTSNALTLNIITGNIYFVDPAGSGNLGTLTSPWLSPTTAVNNVEPGDVVYFRAGTYPAKYLGGTSNFYMTGQQAGTEAAPIAFASYPGEIALFVAQTVGVISSNFNGVVAWWTISKFNLLADTYCVGIDGAGVRVVGCECEGGKIFTSGYGVIFTNGSQQFVLGCSVHDGITGNKLDHALYISGNPSSVRGVELAYNYVYDNDFEAGPMIVINHQSDRIPAGFNCKQHKVHHNWIDCTLAPSRGIGIYHMGWESGNPNGEDEPETALIYNNILVSPSHAFYQVNGNARFLNNTAINVTTEALLVGDADVINSEWINNIFVLSGGDYLTINPGTTGTLTIDNNIWFGIGLAPSEDVNAINSDPLLNATTRAPTSGSPAIDAGSGVAQDVVTNDYYNKQRLTIDIGAVEA